MTKPVKKIQSGVRFHAKYGLLHALRRYWTVRGVGRCGADVFVDRNVRLLRYPQNIFLGERVLLKEGARICPAQPDARIEIGDWTTVGYHTFIFAGDQIQIGANCLLAPFCYLVDSNHGTSRGELIWKQAMTASPIVIGDGVWLGTRVTVLSGVSIGEGAVVGAGSVVKDDVPAFAKVVGNPAKVVGYRE